MAFQISPGVNVSEVDTTTVVPSVLTTAGAFAGTFTWGPANVLKLITNEINLIKTFAPRGPDSDSAVSFFTAANFLSYGNNLQLIRAVGSDSKNATSNNTTGGTQVLNESIFEQSFLLSNNSNTYGSFIGRYPGSLGNSIEVQVCANSSTYATWDYKNYFQSAPGTSEYATQNGGSNDEMHIIVIDRDAAITGVAGTVLETFGFVSKAFDAKLNGVTNYYKQVIFNNSKYVYATDPVDYTNTHTTWGDMAAGVSFYKPHTVQTVSLSGGTDVAPANGDLELAYDIFSNKETVDVSLVLTGGADVTLQNYVINNIANPDQLSDARRDCVVFVSPPQSAVVNNSGNEAQDIQTWANQLTHSSYVFADSGWKYQFDKYNNVYRWIPLNGDMAGLCVVTDAARDPWFSPAGFNRGAIKNVIKLAWNPAKAARDTIYSVGVNPVVSFPGQGVVLFGDKTLQSKPSAFDRINVRRLFIQIERAISNAAKFSLFEQNDEFTRAQFVALITPYLREVQGRRGITDFKVICDTTNNTPGVIDANQFVGDIYIKPTRSINFIQLNFVAVATGVDFTTVVGTA
jgi:hypothetical protein